MSIPIAIPVSAQVNPIAVQFTATFNVPTVNQYNFDVAANKNVLLLEMDNRSVYIIEQLAFSMDIGEDTFQSSIDVIPRLVFKRRVPNKQIYTGNMPFVNYYNDYDTYMFFKGAGGNDALLADFYGILNQVPATVGKGTIRANFQCAIYKINDTDWIKKFEAQKTALGEGLNLRGNYDPRR